MMAGPSGRPSLDNWPLIRDFVPGPERVLTRSGEPVKRKMTEIPEPKDKLDTEVVVSGPEDDAERWRQIDWRRVEADVRRLRHLGCGSGLKTL